MDGQTKFPFVLTILIHKVVMFICLKLKISITAELIEFSILGNLNKVYLIDLSLRMVLGYIFPYNTEPLDASGETIS